MTSRSARYARNVGWGFAGQGAAAVVNFLLVPKLVHGFGPELYGLYLLLPSVAGYLTLASFGAGNVAVRRVSESHSSSAGGALRDVLRHSAALHLGGGAAAAVVLWAASPALAERFFRASPAYRENGLSLLRAAAVGGFFAVGTQWAATALQGLQRFDVQSALAFGQSAAIPVGVFAALKLGHGLGAALAWFVAVQAATFFVSVAALSSVMRGVPRTGGRVEFREVLREGLGFWPGPFAWIVTYQLDRLFIVRSQPLDQLAYYAVPSNLLQRLQTLPSVAAAALVPVVGAAGDDLGDLRRVYVRSLRVLAGLLAPAYLLMFLLMPQFLSLWLGGRFGDDAVWPARLLVIGQASSVLLLPANSVAAGRGRGAWLSIVAWAQALLSLALWRWLIPSHGILGAATAAAVAQCLPTAVCLHAVHSRLLRFGWGGYVLQALGPTLAAGTAMALLVFPLHAAAATWPRFLALGALGGALYATVLWVLLPQDDRELLLRWLKAARSLKRS